MIKNSQFDRNKDGFDTNSQNGDNPPPQDGSCPKGVRPPVKGVAGCWVFIHNYVHDNNDPNVPYAGSAGAGPVGTGMTISGGRNDTVIDNRFANNDAWGVAIVAYPDNHKPCTGGTLNSPLLGHGSCLYDDWGNALIGNKFSDNGDYGNPTNGDFEQLNLESNPSNCFSDNKDSSGHLTPDAAALQKQYPTCTNGKVDAEHQRPVPQRDPVRHPGQLAAVRLPAGRPLPASDQGRHARAAQAGARCPIHARASRRIRGADGAPTGSSPPPQGAGRPDQAATQKSGSPADRPSRAAPRGRRPYTAYPLYDGRLVVKLGSSIVVDERGQPRLDVLEGVCEQLEALRRERNRPGRRDQRRDRSGHGDRGIPARPRAIDELQAASAVGQGQLYQAYDRLLSERGVPTAQVLLTFFDMSARTHYMNARQTLRKLLDWRIVPVINENDTTTTDEISFGDNDFLAAQVAILLVRRAARPAHRRRRAIHRRPSR